MQVLVNGEAVATKASTLDELCASLGYIDAKVATAVNGAFVAAGDRSATPLRPADKVEIVAPRQGG